MKTMWMWMGAGIALCMSACGESPPAAVDGHAGAPSVDGMEAGAVTAPATPFVRATAALADNRMLSPAGDNAVEHYIAARTEASEQVRAQAALAELQPYVLIAAEQAIARGDAAEAARLQGLIERIDAQAPALPRLRTAVATLLREQVIQAAAAVDAPPAPVAATAPTRTTASPTITPAATTAATVPSEPAPAAVSPPAPTVLAQEQPAPSAVPAAVPRTVQAARAPGCCRTRSRAIRCRRCARASKDRRKWLSSSSPTAACAMCACCRRPRRACSMRRPSRWRSAGASRPPGRRMRRAARCGSACRPRSRAAVEWCPYASAARMAA